MVSWLVSKTKAISVVMAKIVPFEGYKTHAFSHLTSVFLKPDMPEEN